MLKLLKRWIRYSKRERGWTAYKVRVIVQSLLNSKELPEENSNIVKTMVKNYSLSLINEIYDDTLRESGGSIGGGFQNLK